MTELDMKALQRKGAAVRVAECQAELAALETWLAQEAAYDGVGNGEGRPHTPPRVVTRLTPARRRAHAAKMKAYWAAWRAEPAR